ncbi:WxL domain-containing protein [Enterococcus sp. 669A]|uniref:WxL domain-containing protein n=1 Tax=Candidatus Enterococcus moelleringii TaxID=2815325 RepID=A0ABS3LJU3_9ENTE|nr:WxL domain-containing protein [Enterococcus sp. 669A]MBO1308629.1 WxL domain-containing protein [Enterococcus sp. 669A]
MKRAKEMMMNQRRRGNQVKSKLLTIVLTITLVISGFLPSVVHAVDGTTIDEQVQLSFAGESFMKVDEDTDMVTLDVHYAPVELEQDDEAGLTVQSEKTDLLVINVPAGLTYTPQDNTSHSFNQETNEIMLDLSYPGEQEPINFAINDDSATEAIELTGSHYVNNVLVGETVPVTLQIEAVAEEEAVEEVAEEEQADHESVMDEVQEAEAVDEDKQEEAVDQVKPEPDAATLAANGNLDLGLATMRKLPVQAVEDGQYSNVSYFSVGSLAEWNRALTTINNNRQEITYLDITNSFAFSNATNNGAVGSTYNGSLTSNKNKKLVINGNGHSLDLRQYTLRFAGAGQWDIVLQNISVQNSNSWGVFDGYNGSNNGNIYTFHNVRQEGVQAFEGSRGRVILSGTSEFTQSPNDTYISATNGAEVRVSTEYGSGNSNIAAREVYIKAGSNITMKNPNYGANIAVFRNGNIFMEEGAPTTLNLDNQESNPRWNSWGGGNDYSVASLVTMNDNPGPSSSNFWTDEERPAELKGLQGSIHISKEAKVTINNGLGRKDYAGAIQLGQGGGSLSIGDRASVDINVEQDISAGGNSSTYGMSGNSQFPVFLFNGATMELGEDASFNLNVGRSVDGNTIYPSRGSAVKVTGSPNEPVIKLGKNSSFSVSSTAYTNGNDVMIDSASRNTFMQINDQATVDLKYTQPTNNSLMRLGNGSSLSVPDDYVHRIRHWDYGNFDEDTDHQYQPIAGTTITYNGTNVSNATTRLDDGFLDTDPPVAQQLQNNFTSNAQRLAIDAVVFNIQSIEPVTNEEQDEYIVQGTAQPPGGMVEIFGGQLDSLPLEERQLLIDSDGRYEWRGNLDRPFYYGESIRASYSGHSEVYAEEPVVDVTRPTAEGRTLHIVEGETIPEAAVFLTSVEDTNPTVTDKSQFAYQFEQSLIQPGSSAVISNGSQQQTYNDSLIVDDTRGNLSDPVSVSLVVHEAGSVSGIRANSTQIRWNEVRDFEVGSVEYEDYLKHAMEAQARILVDYQLKDLTEEIQITNLAEIPTDVGGPYPVIFEVPSEELQTEAELSIKSNLVNPRNPAEGDPENPENNGTGATGELRLDYVPSVFDFGDVMFHWKDMEHKSLGEDDQWVQVADDRAGQNGWAVKASATPFEAEDDQLEDARIVLPFGDLYNVKTKDAKNPDGLAATGETPLSSVATTVFSGTGENSKGESTYVWKKNELKLQIPAGQGKTGKTYRSDIRWVVEAGVTN